MIRPNSQGLWERGKAAWAGVSVDLAIWEGHLARVDLEEPHPDLYLACACAQGDPVAHAVFDRHVLSGVGDFVARIDPTSAFAEEVRQTLRERLLIARPGQLPRIADYSGRGPLGAWVRVAAVRVALDLRGRTAAGEAARRDQLSDAPAIAAPTDPELALIRARYQDEYQAALRDAVAALSPKERNLLRMHFIDGMNIDQIGVVYQVHRATAARWAAAAQKRLLDGVYQILGERLHVSDSELKSLTGAVQSQLHLSLSGLLRSG